MIELQDAEKPRLLKDIGVDVTVNTSELTMLFRVVVSVPLRGPFATWPTKEHCDQLPQTKLSH